MCVRVRERERVVGFYVLLIKIVPVARDDIMGECKVYGR